MKNPRTRVFEQISYTKLSKTCYAAGNGTLEMRFCEYSSCFEQLEETGLDGFCFTFQHMAVHSAMGKGFWGAGRCAVLQHAKKIPKNQCEGNIKRALITCFGLCCKTQRVNLVNLLICWDSGLSCFYSRVVESGGYNCSSF